MHSVKIKIKKILKIVRMSNIDSGRMTVMEVRACIASMAHLLYTITETRTKLPPEKLWFIFVLLINRKIATI